MFHLNGGFQITYGSLIFRVWIFQSTWSSRVTIDFKVEIWKFEFCKLGLDMHFTWKFCEWKSQLPKTPKPQKTFFLGTWKFHGQTDIEAQFSKSTPKIYGQTLVKLRGS